ncbi:MAG: hypothetical protein AAFN77_10650 [Planctomycetota bacterium]
MKTFDQVRFSFPLAVALLFATTLGGSNVTMAQESTAESSELIVADNFDRAKLNEGSIRWKTNDGRALRTSKVAKNEFEPQAKIVDNTLNIVRTKGSDHAATCKTDAAFRNALITFRFQIGSGEKFSFNMNDPNLKTVHAGHICKVEFGAKHVLIQDQKEGVMDLEFRKLRDAKAPKEELDQRLEGKSERTKVTIQPDKWHDAEIKLVNDRIDVTVDGKAIASHASAGIGHPTKQNFAFSVPKTLMVDQLEIRDLGEVDPGR